MTDWDTNESDEHQRGKPASDQGQRGTGQRPPTKTQPQGNQGGSNRGQHGQGTRGQGNQPQRGSPGRGQQPGGPSGGRPPQQAGGGDDGITLGRRELLGGAAVGALLLGGAGYHFLTRGPSGAQAVVADYVEAMDDHDWEAAAELLHEDAPTSLAIEQEDVDAKSAVIGWGEPDDVTQSLEGVYEAGHWTGDEAQAVLQGEYQDQEEWEDLRVPIDGGDDVVRVDLEIPDIEEVSMTTAMVDTQFVDDAVDEFEEQMEGFDEDAIDAYVAQAEGDGFLIANDYLVVYDDGWYLWGEV